MDSIVIVQQWQDAANRQDVSSLLELSASSIEIVGPRGVTQGHNALASWVQHAGAWFVTRRSFVRGERVVVAQHGTWHSSDSGKVVGAADVATSFQVRYQRVARVARYDELAQALQDAGLTMSDEQLID